MSGNQTRLQAIEQITNRAPMSVSKTEPLSKIWATDVFNLQKMEEALSKNAFKAIKKTVQTGEPLDAATADVVAAAMKDWALSKGVKFFSHVFYPMTNITAEKHDGLIVTNTDGGATTATTGISESDEHGCSNRMTPSLSLLLGHASSTLRSLNNE